MLREMIMLTRKTFRYTALSLAVLFLISSVRICTFAAPVGSDTNDVVAFGIMTPDETGDYRWEEPMTRAEFVTAVGVLLRLDSVSVGNSGIGFTDIPEDAPYRSTVHMLHQMGYLNGYEDHTFRPNENISLNEAVKILMDVMGYQPICLCDGGYPNGYLFNAAKVRLTNKVESGAAFTRATAARLIQNALDIETLVENAYSNGDVEYKKGPVLRDLFENRISDSVVKATGKVTANAATWLVKPIANLKKNQVEIDGVIYFTGNTLAADYLGMEVEYYVTVGDTDSVNTLLYVKPTAKNEVVSIRADQFSSAKDGRIYYDVTGNDTVKTLYCDLAPDAVLVKNAGKVTSYSDEDITVANGGIRLTDNDGDGSYDVIMIDDYTSVVVKSVSGDTIYFDNNESVAGDKNLTVDVLDKEKQFVIRDKDGAELSAQDIKTGDVLSVSASAGKDRYTIIVSSETAEGIITGKDDKGISVGDEYYEFENGKYTESTVSDSVKIFLNYEGKVVRLKPISRSDNYGYIVGFSENQGLQDKSVRVLKPGELKDDYIIDDTDENNIIKTPILRAGNAGLEVYRLAAKVKIDGVTYTDTKAMERILDENRLIRFDTDQSGEIKKIEFPVQIGAGEKRIFNAYEKVFGGVLSGGFGIDDTTRVICSPLNAVSSEDDYLAKIDMTSNGKEESIKGYDIDEDTHIAKIVVLSVNLQAGAAGNITDKPAVAESVTKVSDENGDVRTKVKFWSEGKSFQYYVSEYAAADAKVRMSKLTAGSIFYYSKDTEDNLADVEILHSIHSDKDFYPMHDNKLFGYIAGINYHTLSSYQSRFVNRLTVVTSESGMTQTVDLNVRNAPVIYLYETKKKKVHVVSAEDIVASSDPDYADRVFVSSVNQVIHAIVLVRD